MKRLILFIMSLVLLSSFTFAVVDDAEYYYSFDSSSLIGGLPKDLTLNKQPLNKTGATSGVTGILNEAFQFDGNDYLEYDKLGNEDTERTYSFWINSGTNTDTARFFQQGNEIEARCSSSACNNFYIKSNDLAVTTTGTYANSNWYHIVATVKANNLTVFVNGQKDGEDLVGTPATDSSTTLYIGSEDGTKRYFIGKIDELAYYDNIKEASSIKSLWNNGNGYNPYGTSGFENISISYNSTISEEINNEFSLLFTDYNLTNDSNATLIYNNQEYPGIINYQNSSYVEFKVNINSPLSENQSDVRQFYWNYTIQNATGNILNNQTNLLFQAVNWNLTRTPRLNITARNYTGKIVNNFSVWVDGVKLADRKNGYYFLNNKSCNTCNIGITSVGHSYLNQTANFTKGVLKPLPFLEIGIDNCSVFNVHAINFSIKDEETGDLIFGDTTGFFNVYYGGKSIYNVSLDWKDTTSPSICIPNVNSTYNLYGQVEYTNSSDDYETRYYYFENLEINGITNEIDLFLLNESTSTDVVFTVLDENDDPIKGVLIKILKYDVGTNTSETVNIIQTDSDGNAVGNLILSTQFYRFILEYNGEAIFSSDPTKITVPSKTFRVTLTTDYFDDYTDIKDMMGYITFTNATKIFDFVFSDNTNNVNRACLTIERNTINGKSMVNETCVSSSAGTISLKINEDVLKNSYLATGVVYIDNERYVLAVESVSYNELYKKFGIEGIMMTFIIVLTLTMIGVSSGSPVISVLLFILGFIGSIIMGVFFMNWVPLVVYVILGGVVLYRVSRN